MIEIYPNVFTGDQHDFDGAKGPMGTEIDDFYVLHCCKEPYHRQFVGYAGRGAPKDHPEYLYARRGNRMALNMVDAPKSEFFNPDMIKVGLKFLEEGYATGKKLLIHCNVGESRGPSMAMLYVYKYHVDHASDSGPVSFDDALSEMIHIYPAYNPGPGIRAHLMQHWGEY